MKKFNFILALFATAFLLSGSAWSATATAIIKGTTPDSPVKGVVTLAEENGGLSIMAKVSGVPEGSHGFHIHAIGNCDDMGKAAGGHFNPDKSPHGLYPKDGPMNAMAGDMGNIVVGSDGNGTFSVFMPKLTLKDGKYAVNGLSVILHEKVDDFTQPAGNSGGRIGCGIIEEDSPVAAAPAVPVGSTAPAAPAQKTGW